MKNNTSVVSWVLNHGFAGLTEGKKSLLLVIGKSIGSDLVDEEDERDWPIKLGVEIDLSRGIGSFGVSRENVELPLLNRRYFSLEEFNDIDNPI